MLKYITMEQPTKTVISKSTKRRKVTSAIMINGEYVNKEIYSRTEMVVYRTKMSNGKMHSITKHEISKDA
jgi:hypothetical protein